MKQSFIILALAVALGGCTVAVRTREVAVEVGPPIVVEEAPTA